MPQWQSQPNLPRGESREISYILVGSGFAYRSLGATTAEERRRRYARRRCRVGQTREGSGRQPGGRGRRLAHQEAAALRYEAAALRSAVRVGARVYPGRATAVTNAADRRADATGSRLGVRGPGPHPRDRVAPVAVRARLRWVAAPLPDRSWDRRGGWRVGRASLVEKPDRPCAYRGDGHDDLGPRPHGAGGPAARRLREDTARLALPRRPGGGAELDFTVRLDATPRRRHGRPRAVAARSSVSLGFAHPRIRGSRASRTASPTKFNPTTVTNRAAPGPKTIHGAC